ncbi:integrase core domain-containing protein [Roseicyclus marinus]|uniref:integrase core domain-containing protein n=1 Tax=Roseicyclus marinus TaxID=2161673 RepID=UPI003620BC7F
MGMLLLQTRTSIRSLLRSGAVFPINGRLRDELLSETLFSTLGEAREKIRAWQYNYNHHRNTPASGTSRQPSSWQGRGWKCAPVAPEINPQTLRKAR